MFEDLFNHSKEREPLQALGFYIVFLIIGLALGVFGDAVFLGQILKPGCWLGM